MKPNWIWTWWIQIQISNRVAAGRLGSALWKTGWLWSRSRSMPRSILSQWAQQLFSTRLTGLPSIAAGFEKHDFDGYFPRQSLTSELINPGELHCTGSGGGDTFLGLPVSLSVLSSKRWQTCIAAFSKSRSIQTSVWLVSDEIMLPAPSFESCLLPIPSGPSHVKLCSQVLSGHLQDSGPYALTLLFMTQCHSQGLWSLNMSQF